MNFAVECRVCGKYLGKASVKATGLCGECEREYAKRVNENYQGPANESEGTPRGESLAQNRDGRRSS